MTDQSPNDQFHASSFMQGHNAEYLEQLYARYANNPAPATETGRLVVLSSSHPEAANGTYDVLRELDLSQEGWPETDFDGDLEGAQGVALQYGDGPAVDPVPLADQLGEVGDAPVGLGARVRDRLLVRDAQDGPPLQLPGAHHRYLAPRGLVLRWIQ